MLVISSATLILTATTLIYIVAVGWLLLTLFSKKEDMRIASPLLTMLQIAGISGVVFMMASVPSYVASMLNPDILPFIMPYAGVLLAVSFVVFIIKLESKQGGWAQARVALSFAATISAALLLARFLLPAVFTSAGL